MVRTYRYRLPERFDPYYLRAILQKKFGNKFIGWSETTKEMRIDFTEELTETEKAELDKLMANPPMPAAVYEFGAIDLEDEIERVVGVRPVFVEFDEERWRAKVMFDRELTATQEVALKAFFEGFKGVFKRRL